MNNKTKLEEAKFYFVNQNYDEAEKILKDLIKKEPKNVEALFLYGLLFEVTNQLEKAKEYFEKVLVLNPSHKEAREHLEKVQELY